MKKKRNDPWRNAAIPGKRKYYRNTDTRDLKKKIRIPIQMKYIEMSL